MSANKTHQQIPSRVHSKSDNLSFLSGKKLSLEAHNLSSNSLTRIETPVTQLGQKRNRKGVAKNGETTVNSRGGAESEHEVHILTERERRKKMRNMFTSLHALLPQLPAKADKSTIVDEAIKYINTLQETLQTLEKLQGATLVDSEPSVITSNTEAIESREAFMAIQGPSKSSTMATNMPHSFPVSLFPSCFQTWFSPNVVMNMCGDDAQISKHNLDVVSAHISSDQFRSIYMIHVHAGGTSGQYPEALSVEDTFKLAAGEMLWLLPC
ncbi:hypothetical protein P3X46_021035 [Hevea brasiliensis]|uniref:BHLH domain-containing protein n=1 Tax=Hevea brasiliensis TaxID=3981 RepID=A0ABQ9LGA0_HEVBR|nr:hypothetical protein P3X46_021035 [Hevea brasiliensis]